jgi:hypothetical protein
MNVTNEGGDQLKTAAFVLSIIASTIGTAALTMSIITLTKRAR